MNNDAKLPNERADFSAADLRVWSFETADGQAAVRMEIPGSVLLSMSPGQALRLGARITAAAVVGEKFRVEGEVVEGQFLADAAEKITHDVIRELAARLAAAYEELIRGEHGPGGPGSPPPEST